MTDVCCYVAFILSQLIIKSNLYLFRTFRDYIYLIESKYLV